MISSLFEYKKKKKYRDNLDYDINPKEFKKIINMIWSFIITFDYSNIQKKFSLSIKKIKIFIFEKKKIMIQDYRRIRSEYSIARSRSIRIIMPLKHLRYDEPR